MVRGCAKRVTHGPRGTLPPEAKWYTAPPDGTTKALRRRLARNAFDSQTWMWVDLCSGVRAGAPVRVVEPLANNSSVIMANVS